MQLFLFRQIWKFRVMVVLRVELIYFIWFVTTHLYNLHQAAFTYVEWQPVKAAIEVWFTMCSVFNLYYDVTHLQQPHFLFLLGDYIR